MRGKRLRHSGKFQFLEHRGFSLDLLHQGLRVIPLETVESEQRENPVAGIFDGLLAEIAVSAGLKDGLVALGAPAEKVTVLRNGVDLGATLDEFGVDAVRRAAPAGVGRSRGERAGVRRSRDARPPPAPARPSPLAESVPATARNSLRSSRPVH